MRAGRRSITWVAALAGVGSVASAQTGNDITAFEVAMARPDPLAATEIFDRLVESRRPADGKLRPDPLLNAMAGRIVLSGGNVAVARAYLERSMSPGLPGPTRTEVALALAHIHEYDGDRAEAAATLRAIESKSTTDEQRRRLEFAKARLATVADPRAALPLLTSLAAQDDQSDGWEIQLMLARAHALLGDSGAARVAADRAWSAAVTAPADAQAPLRVALQRAAIAAMQGDRASLLAMLNISGAAATEVDSALAEYAPVCGEQGITRDDHVTFGVHTGNNPQQWVVPVAASRPEAATPFADAIAGHRPLSKVGEAPGGTLFTLRCRSRPSPTFNPPFALEEKIVEWMADRGLFFSMSRGKALEDINWLAGRVAGLEERFGADHPFLIPARMELMDRLMMRATTAEDVQEWQVNRLKDNVMAAIRAIGGADSFLPSEALAAKQQALSHATTQQQALMLGRAVAADAVEASPPDAAYSLAMRWFREDVDLPPETESRVVESLLKRFADRPGDRRTRALMMRRAALQVGLGDRDSAHATYRAAGVPNGSCVLADTAPAIIETKVEDDDYPLDVMNTMLTGVSVVEFSVTAAGRPDRARLVLSAPATLFDGIVAEELKEFRLSPAHARGRARACDGHFQRIIWRLPQPADFELPTFAEPTQNAT